jgi:YD repeat-containing protein
VEGRVTALGETAGAFTSRTWSYTHDNIHRLTAASYTGNSWSYGLDAADNLTSIGTPGGTVTPSYNTLNQNSALTYDANGSVTADATRGYKWDAENRLVEIDYTGTSNKTTFAFDGLGRRLKQVEVTGSSVESRFLWCGGTICQQRDGSNAITRRYVAEGEYRNATSTGYVYQRDHLGSVRDAIIASSGTRTASYDYDPYVCVAERVGNNCGAPVASRS